MGSNGSNLLPLMTQFLAEINITFADGDIVIRKGEWKRSVSTPSISHRITVADSSGKVTLHIAPVSPPTNTLSFATHKEVIPKWCLSVRTS